MIILGAPNDPGVFGSWLLLPCWQSDKSICNGSVGANRTCSVGLLSNSYIGFEGNGGVKRKGTRDQ